MPFIILALIIFVVGIYWFVRYPTDSKEQLMARVRKFLLLLALATLGFVLLRIGLPILAAAIGVLVTLLPIMDRAFSIWQKARWVQQWVSYYKQKKSQPKHGHTTSTTQPLGVQEAASILGVSEDATKEEIQRAYYRLMREHHPDQGGSAEHASLINRAREVLLQHNR